jgi:uncharacterized protein YegL
MKTRIFNLIILDESGSMESIHNEAISGCNETIQTIRNAQKENAETQEQFVSVVLFNGSTKCNVSYLRENIPADMVKELGMDEYRPNDCTPLYDAVGFSVNKLYDNIKGGHDTIGMVTIITDGYENSSKEYDLRAVKGLIERLKGEGWIFTFIGADIDAQEVAHSMNIASSYQFDKTGEGTNRMWEEERRARNSTYSRISNTMKMMIDSSEEDRRAVYARNNENFFGNNERITPSNIETLAPNEIFVFGSNAKGEHTGGASKTAVDKFGAVMGQGEGIQGQSYAIPTVMLSEDEMGKAVARFIDFAAKHTSYNFMVTAVGCGNAGYSVETMAKLFEPASRMSNVWFPKEFWDNYSDSVL